MVAFGHHRKHSWNHLQNTVVLYKHDLDNFWELVEAGEHILTTPETPLTSRFSNGDFCTMQGNKA